MTLAKTTVERGLWRGSLLSCSFIKALRFGESPRVWLSCGIARIEPPTYMPARFGGAAAHFCRRMDRKNGRLLVCHVRGATRDPPSPAVARGKATFAKARASRAAAALYEPYLHRRYRARCVQSSAGSSPCPRVARVPLNEVGLMMAIPEK